jgi:hypothetical protein
MEEIRAATAVLHAGDRAAARSRLEDIWSRIADNPQPMHECALSHSLADVQDDIIDELAWDLRSLEAALRCTREDIERHSEAASIAAFLPSVHANLAQDYLKLGDLARSGEHLASARSFVSALPDDAYGQLVRNGIEHIAARLAVAADAGGGRASGETNGPAEKKRVRRKSCGI